MSTVSGTQPAACCYGAHVSTLTHGPCLGERVQTHTFTGDKNSAHTDRNGEGVNTMTLGEWLFKKFYFKNFVFLLVFQKKVDHSTTQKSGEQNNSAGLETPGAEAQTDRQTDRQAVRRTQLCSGPLLSLWFLPPARNTSKHAMGSATEKSL